MTTILLAALLGQISQRSKPVVIGTHYADALAGLSVYRGVKDSVVLNFGWVGADGKPHQGYNDLVDAKVHFGEAAPDDTYHRISWTVGTANVTYEWGLLSPGRAIGRVSSDAPIELRPSIRAGWPGSQLAMDASPHSVEVLSGELRILLDLDGRELPSGPSSGGCFARYTVDKNSPVSFAVTTDGMSKPAHVGSLLDAARKKYNSSRLWAEGDWGDFLSPIENQLGNTKIYSPETARLAHIVSRGWCLPDGQILFCWDSFFNGLLSSLDDPKMARNTVRAILAEAQPAGFIPNFGGSGSGVSTDRSQPPVGSYCIWKMNQRDPDIAFLAEVYPKLLKWHRWWFSPRKNGNSPTRDGNGDGLLEWGTETGVLQNARFESGLDDSPMYDDGAMAGPNMTMDSTDLSALWAMDADYLSRIAATLGKNEDAKQLQKERSDMARRIDRLMWNDTLGTYCYRYWTPKPATESYPSEKVFSDGDKPGFTGEYFEGRELQAPAKVRQDKAINFNWSRGPIDGIGNSNFSVRWTSNFIVPKTGSYAFETSSDDGCRLWIDGKKVIDVWSIHGSAKNKSETLQFKAGEKHRVRLEYFQAEGGAEVSLRVHRIVTEKPAVNFLPRVSPLNFYPLIVDAPSTNHARRTVDLFFRPDQFGGQFVCPTISKSDPAYPAQGYWRGTVWGPTSYLTYQGLRRYATGAQMTDFAQKSVALFMKNWNADGSCHENFNSITGWGRSDPHYTWGALLCLIGLEQLCDTDAEGRISLNGASGRHIRVHNLRLNGRIFDLVVEPTKAMLLERGKVVGVARHKVEFVRL